MVLLGVLAASDSLVRAAGHAGRDVPAFYIVPLMDMVIFATLLAFAFSRPARSGGAQAADLSSNDGAADCRGGALALRYRQSKCAGGSAVFVRFSVGADELRPVVHTEDSSRYAMGWHVRRCLATTVSSDWANRLVARLRKLSCRLTLVNRSYFFIWLCSSFTTRSQALFLPVSRPPQTWESLHRLSPVLGSITVKMQARTEACQPESTTGSSRT